MFSLTDILKEALGLILSWDQNLSEIVMLSLRVTLTAVVISCLIGLPLGAMIGAFRFPGRGIVTVFIEQTPAGQRLSHAIQHDIP